MTFVKLLPAVSALALVACSVGPNYVPPLPAANAQAPLLTASAPVSDAQTPGQWWKLYDDPVLDGLVGDALAANTDIRVAVARLDRAKASLRGARSDLLPQTTLSASPAYGRLPSDQRLPGTKRNDWQVDAGLDVSYELDLSGRVRREIEAAHGDVGAAAADVDAVRVSIVAETIGAYVEAASAAEQIKVAQSIVALLDHSVGITQKRLDAGRAERLDVVRLATLADQRRAEIPPLIAQREAALYRLAMLTGRTPDALPSVATARDTTPEIRQLIPVGDGGTLLARRPDVRAAERRLAANTARIGVATADLYPRIVLGGSIGQSSTGFSNLFGGGPLRWLLGPLISWNFPNQSAARARIAEARADRDGSLASFDGAVLRALQETDTALSAYAQSLNRRQALKTAHDDAARASRIVQARQREGQVDYLTLIDAERTDAEAAAALAQSQYAVASAQVDLFRALGGGWQEAGTDAGGGWAGK
ncbi:efflux transporter outer membrane subunit [Sphingomonas crusticola]|uniref:efflux transporter outer membrane subunit n=1 Tax=Sphingomonas crusticola TaxID=1697973 RepID=UPI000E26C952|nr:efflux transporter outer membrane subunit [Sphingomonas crusticola]